MAAQLGMNCTCKWDPMVFKMEITNYKITLWTNKANIPQYPSPAQIKEACCYSQEGY